MAAENHSTMRLTRLARRHASLPGGQALICPMRRGSRYICKKLSAINVPETANTQFLCRDNVTSQGTAERNDATVAPRPTNTSSKGRAQHSRALNEVNSER